MATASPSPPVPSLRAVFDVLIADGASLSDIVDLKGYTLVGIQVPSGWDAADITFQASGMGSAFNDLYTSDDTEYAIEAAASRYIAIPYADFVGLRFLKVRSGTTGSPVNQSGAVTLSLIGVREA